MVNGIVMVNTYGKGQCAHYYSQIVLPFTPETPNFETFGGVAPPPPLRFFFLIFTF